MQIRVLKTPRITSLSIALPGLLDATVQDIKNGEIVVITSKIVSLCEGNTVPISDASKDELMVKESTKYLPASLSKYGFHFTITNNTLIPMAGIDQSNTGEYYALWPRDPQNTANQIREYLCKRFNLQKVGVVITDSTCQPLRTGTMGICLAHSGFSALHDYVDTPDLFGRPMRVTQSNISGGIAAAAVVYMGEGAESTPLAVVSDVDFVSFQLRNPTPKELDLLQIPLEDDLFAPFLQSVKWSNGQKQ
jgi:F420-0:gamma-glutamyl ligase